MKRPINVQPEVKAYYLEIQMQGVRMREKKGAGGGLVLYYRRKHWPDRKELVIGPCYPTQT